MAPSVQPATTTTPDNPVVFVPVDGRVVFTVCCLLILLCVVWLGLWLHKGVRFEESE